MAPKRSQLKELSHKQLPEESKPINENFLRSNQLLNNFEVIEGKEALNKAIVFKSNTYRVKSHKIIGIEK